MTIVKKILSVVLSIVIVCTAFAVGASAEGTATGDEYMTITVSTTADSYLPSDTVTVQVSIANNFNCPSFRFPIMFDSSVYELPAVTGLTAVGDCKTNGTLSSNLTNDGTFIPSNYNADNFGCILVQWTANVVSGAVGVLNNEAGQVVLTFNLTVKSDATVGTAGTIFVPAEYDGFYYQAITDVTDATSFYYMSADTLTRTFNAANPTIIGDPIVLSAKEGSTTVVDETNRYIYALNSPMLTTQAFDDYISLSGTNATLQYEATSYGYGTGTKVKVMLGENVVTAYDVVIFGDANGDSYVDAYDISEIRNVANALSTFDAVQMYAMDIVGSTDAGDGLVDAFDLAKVRNVANALAALSQTNPYQ